MNRNHKYFLSLLAAFFVTVLPAHAVDYYISGSSGNDINPGTLASPWKTIQKANSRLQAGDTVYIRGGTYQVAEGVNPANTGLPGRPITYKNYGSETVEFVGASDNCTAVNLNSDSGIVRSYIVVDGLRFKNFMKHLWILRGSYNEIANCTFQGTYARADHATEWRGSTIYRNAQYNHVHHCVFSDYGTFYNNEDNGVVFELGNENVGDDDTAYNLIEDNQFYHGGHHVMGITGNHNVVRRNYIHNETWWPTANPQYGNRVLMFTGLQPACQRNLVEDNRVAFGGETSEPDQIGGAGGTLATSYNIIRRNMFYNTLLYALNISIYPGMVSSYNHIYNNVFFHNGYTTTTKPNMSPEYTHAIYFGVSGDDANTYTYIHDNAIKNNIFHDNRNKTNPATPIVRFGQSWGGFTLKRQQIENNWLEAGDPGFENSSGSVNPMYDSIPDFRLVPNSPCIDAGGFLTTIASATGSGTTFVVEDAGYFMDGWGIIEADVLQLAGQSVTANVMNVDYTSNTITVDRMLNWTRGQGVSLQYAGAAPDLGAYEGTGNPVPRAPSGLRVKP
jgi:hypothetical protein